MGCRHIRVRLFYSFCEGSFYLLHRKRWELYVGAWGMDLLLDVSDLIPFGFVEGQGTDACVVLSKNVCLCFVGGYRLAFVAQGFVRRRARWGTPVE